MTVEGTLPSDLSPAAQRAVYRTVQEALTNVRKHAPGAAITVTAWSNAQTYGVTIANGAPSEEPLALPSAGIGLRGLRERAELLGGSLEAGPAGDGFAVRLTLPRSPG